MDAALRSSPAVRGSVRRTGGLLLAGRDHNGCWSTCDVHMMAAHDLVIHCRTRHCSSRTTAPPTVPPSTTLRQSTLHPFPTFLGKSCRTRVYDFPKYYFSFLLPPYLLHLFTQERPGGKGEAITIMRCNSSCSRAGEVGGNNAKPS